MTDLYSECVIGYRWWRLVGDDLMPVAVGPAWVPGVNRAVCHAGRDHHAPDGACDCGLYAHHEIHGRPRGGFVALGAVAAWGDIQVHRTGFRAEYAQIVGLSTPIASVRARLRFGADMILVSDTFERAAAYLCEHWVLPLDDAAPRILTPAGRSPLGLPWKPDRTVLLPGWDEDLAFADAVRAALAECGTTPEACHTTATFELKRPSITRAAARYGVPLVDPADLVEHALQFGAPLPESARPAEDRGLVVDLPPRRPQPPRADAPRRVRGATRASTRLSADRRRGFTLSWRR